MHRNNDRFEHGGMGYGVAVWNASATAEERAGSGRSERACVPLILLHGFSQSAASWDEVAPLLAADRVVYGLDLIGHGVSDRPPDTATYTLAAQGDALLAFARHVAKAEGARPAVLGYSMGGRVTLSALARSASLASDEPSAPPFSAIILEAAGLGPATPDDRAAAVERDARCAARLRADGLESFMDYWEQLPLFATQRTLPPHVRARLRSGRLANDAEALARTFDCAGQHAMPDSASSLAVLAALRQQRIPLLYVAGACDAKYGATAARLAAEVRCEMRLVAGAGHNVHLEAPEAFAHEVKAFLSSHLGCL